MSTSDHILIVDDDRELRRLLGDYLARNGFRVSAAANGREMRQALKVSAPDLIVLDLMLPGTGGLDLCRELRGERETPIIMLTALDEETERVIGLELGADDYLGKPFNPRELLARIKGVLRRTRTLPPNMHPTKTASTFRFAGWRYQRATHELTAHDGVVVPLSAAERRLLEVFLDHPQVILNRDQLLDLTRGRDATPFDRSVDVQVSRLRQKLRDDAREPMLVKTVRSEGYQFAAEVERE